MFSGDETHKQLLVILVYQMYSTRASLPITWMMYLGSLNTLLTYTSHYVQYVTISVFIVTSRNFALTLVLTVFLGLVTAPLGLENAFRIRNSALRIRNSALRIRNSALGIRNSALGIRKSALRIRKKR